MTSTTIRMTAAAILVVPFVVLGLGYADLPQTFPLARTWDGRTTLWGERSLLTVFRVPMIGAVTAAAAELMRSHFEKISGVPNHLPIQRFWLTLLLTACVKSLLEGLDLATMFPSRRDGFGVFGIMTLATLLGGLSIAATQLPQAWSSLKDRDHWRTTPSERWALAGLVLLYGFFAIFPLILVRWKPA